eukprot:4296431-Pyramimonas_sp.AAC.1
MDKLSIAQRFDMIASSQLYPTCKGSIYKVTKRSLGTPARASAALTAAHRRAAAAGRLALEITTHSVPTERDAGKGRGMTSGHGKSHGKERSVKSK